MPHVSSFRFHAKPGERQAVIDSFQRWDDERRKSATGFVRGILASSHSDPDDFMATVIFDTTENYNANSNAPETNTWFQELRSHLNADPDWFDAKLEVQMLA